MTREREGWVHGKLKRWLSYKKVRNGDEWRRKIASWCRFMESHQFSMPIEILLINTMYTWLDGEQKTEVKKEEHSSNTLSRFLFFCSHFDRIYERKTIVTNFMAISIITIVKMFSSRLGSFYWIIQTQPERFI